MPDLTDLSSVVDDANQATNRLIGQNIKDLRRKARKPRADLAKELGVEEDFLRGVEIGAYRLSSSHVYTISQLLKVSLEEIIPQPDFDPAFSADTSFSTDPYSQTVRLLQAFKTIKSDKQRAAIVLMVERSAGMPPDTVE